MITIRNIKMPDNCHECDAIGLSDIVGLGCPCEMDREKYSFTERPKECPLIWEKTMTDREAIEFLKNMIDREYEHICITIPQREGDVSIWQYHIEALQKAIKVLEEKMRMENDGK